MQCGLNLSNGGATLLVETWQRKKTIINYLNKRIGNFLVSRVVKSDNRPAWYGTFKSV